MATVYRTQRAQIGYGGAISIVYSDAVALKRARAALSEAIQEVGIPCAWEEIAHPAAGGAFIVVGRRKVQSDEAVPRTEDVVAAIRASARPRRLSDPPNS